MKVETTVSKVHLQNALKIKKEVTISLSELAYLFTLEDLQMLLLSLPEELRGSIFKEVAKYVNQL